MPSGTQRSLVAGAGALPSRFRNGFSHGTNLAVASRARCPVTLMPPGPPAQGSVPKPLLVPIFSAPVARELLCRREKRGTVERDRYLSPHHREQNSDASRGVESLERAHEIGK